MIFFLTQRWHGNGEASAGARVPMKVRMGDPRRGALELGTWRRCVGVYRHSKKAD